MADPAPPQELPSFPDGTTVIRAQEGPQRVFMSTPADIAIYGGAAGGGKSWGLLLDPIRDLDVPDFSAVFFRRNTVQVRNPGGLWDASGKLYYACDGTPNHMLKWTFPSGAKVQFAHLEYDNTVIDWQGSEIPLIGFDELTHFSASQFWYMLSRSRSTCGVPPRVRATCNPDVDSWVATFIAWWIDQSTGYPIPERSGVLRYFARVNDVLVWADSREELLAAHPTVKPAWVKSLTFIPAKLSDNKVLTDADPAYEANLMALPKVERERLLGGNWKIRASAGLLFQRSWCRVIDTLPAGLEMIRGWDFAATQPTAENPDPDSTASVKIGRTSEGRFVVIDSTNHQEGPSGVERLLRNTASQDGVIPMQSLPQDPGAAGKSQVLAQVKALVGFNVRYSTESGDKVTRFNPFSAQAEAGNIDVLRGEWNERWFSSLENFPPPSKSGHDDDADATSRAFNSFLEPIKGAAFLELARRENAAAEARRLKVSTSKPEWQPGSMEYAAEQAELARLKALEPSE